ncbi:family 43 glycosylhydrolase [Fibrobacter succinogenes]|uniref:Arabinan endo-1,5-alpha-L-arabinosidase n=1 Tax=Fibrobacter succinogenes TaxID=833 RepID=A0A380RUN7_FIBSU|nr:family 43 glycosylhydrolase [Fibrobacter succinogenes]PWJ36875.1 arabinan endo-1,5-alpha-L-arabinosidase [Fibrobacter succinogenes subsp. elongatus]SUQ19124.1 arabinan endo-1,5-alpha-L-arabinosidase [Fibrobacter succinogenes]
MKVLNFANLVKCATFATIGAFGVSAVSAADWYAKDNLQPGHDPSMIRFEDGYALMSTNNNLQLWTSEDAYTWRDHKSTVSKIPQWAYTYAPTTEGIWAPDIYYMNGEYRVYYCVSVFGKRTSAIGYQSTKSIMPGTTGYGWTDHGHVFHTVASDKYNAIDADVVRDTEGNYWMAFGSFGLGIQLIKLDAKTGYQASDDKTVYNIARRTSKASNGAEEGPSLIEHGGQYFLFTAWDICCQQGANIEQTTYKTAYGRADKVTGPYKDRAGYDMANGGGTILMERYGRYVGPGGGEAFQDLNRVRFVHHYYDLNGDKYNHIHIRDVVFTDDNWAEMGQPFLGRYLSAEVEHGALTRAVSGDLAITRSNTASNGEYLAYINTAGSKIRLPMNIMQAGEYLLRYRYANGGEGDATHKVTVNGKSQTVTLPPTGSWGTFPEKSIVMIPATLKRGGNFIEIEPQPNGFFSELDRIDFLRVIRDTIPANGFDNGIRVRLTDKDEFAIKDGGYAIFENVVTDSIKSDEVSIQVKNATAGKLAIRDGAKNGIVLAECDLSMAKAAANGWSEANCGTLKSKTGIKDFYLTASGVSGEAIVGNILFKRAPLPESSSSSAVAESSSSEMIVSSSSESPVTLPIVRPSLNYSIAKIPNGYRVHFDNAGAHQAYLLNPMGQIVSHQKTNGTDIEFNNLPKGRFIVKVK